MGGQASKLGWPVMDLRGKTAIVTGGNSGIGFETAKHLAIMGAKVIIACRSEAKAQAAMLRMQADYLELRNVPIPNFRSTIPEPENGVNHLPVPGQNDDVGSEIGSTNSNMTSFSLTDLNVEYMHLDLNSLSSVAEFVGAFRDKNLDLNFLICNAGVMGIPRTLSEDGFEAHYQVNYLAHFLLTLYLLPIMRRSGEDVRIINITDEVHTSGKLDLENMQGNRSYDRTGFYANSKLYQIMSTYSFQRRLESSNISLYSVHPGAIDTNISKNMKDTFTGSLVSMNKKLGLVTSDLQKGAATTISVAVSPHMKELAGYYFATGVPATPSPRSRDVKKQEALWIYTLQCLKDRITEDFLIGLNVEDMSEDNRTMVEDALAKIKVPQKK